MIFCHRVGVSSFFVMDILKEFFHFSMLACTIISQATIRTCRFIPSLIIPCNFTRLWWDTSVMVVISLSNWLITSSEENLLITFIATVVLSIWAWYTSPYWPVRKFSLYTMKALLYKCSKTIGSALLVNKPIVAIVQLLFIHIACCDYKICAAQCFEWGKMNMHVVFWPSRIGGSSNQPPNMSYVAHLYVSLL